MTPDHEVMVANILEVFARGTTDQMRTGISWYPAAGIIIRRLSDITGTDPWRFAHALAALSPRNPWRWNVQDAYAFASAVQHGEPMPVATTFKRNWHAAWHALADEGQPWTGAALKVRAFVAACMGDQYAVVVDVWAWRIATGTRSDKKITKRDYQAISAAYAEAAYLEGVSPSQMQAITWVIAQAEGLHGRKVKHNYKSGTASIVVTVMEDRS